MIPSGVPTTTSPNKGKNEYEIATLWPVNSSVIYETIRTSMSSLLAFGLEFLAESRDTLVDDRFDVCAGQRRVTHPYAPLRR